MKIWFTKTSYYSGCGNVREFNNLDEAINSLLEECSKDGKYGRNPELIIQRIISVIIPSNFMMIGENKNERFVL